MSVLVSRSSAAPAPPRRSRSPASPEKRLTVRQTRCSFGVRPSRPQTSPSSPGPVAYAIPRGVTRRGSDCSPAFSLRGKTAPGTASAAAKGAAPAKDEGPGPAAYFPRAPAPPPFAKGFSLGSRARYDPFVKRPDPCAYTLPSSFDAALAPRRLPTFSARPRSMFDVRRDGPDPAQYDVTDASRYKKAAPRFSFGRRAPLAWGLAPSPSDRARASKAAPATPHDLISNVLLKKKTPS